MHSFYLIEINAIAPIGNSPPFGRLSKHCYTHRLVIIKKNKLGGKSMPEIVIYIIIGAAAGILSGLFGIGGGIIIIPGLVFLKGFSQLKAQGTSLVAMLPPVGILAFLQYYKKGNVNIYAGIVICITMLICAKFGAQLASRLPMDIMKKAFGIFIILIGIKTFIGK